MPDSAQQQLLHLVIGGELTDLEHTTFKDLDAEPLGGDGVEFAVAMPRDQHLGAMALLGLDERRQEMLAVPERQDRRLHRLDQFVDIGRIVTELVGQPDQPQILGREETHSMLNPAAAQQIANELFQRAGFVS